MSAAPTKQPLTATNGSDLNPNDVLDVRDLRVHYVVPGDPVIAVNGVNFTVRRGETVGLVGESGCGKTTTAMAVLRLVQPPGRIVGGQVWVNGTDMVRLNQEELRQTRWREVALIPQGAMNSLNPVMKVKDQIGDAIVTHGGQRQDVSLKQQILELLDDVGLPARTYDLYPHELSGGMKQRVCIAMAISLNPPLIIADEPTSALDVVVQRVVAQTLLDVKRRLNVAMILIGHDMGLQAQLVDRIAVMYAGNIVELAPVKNLFTNPLHPYSELLIAAIPSIKEKKPLVRTEGVTHDLRYPPSGCVFRLRCPKVFDRCSVEIPRLREVKPDHRVACHLY